MLDPSKLSHAPITEAIIQFQANASKVWNAGEVGEKFGQLWPETQVQQLQPVKLEFEVQSGEEPQQRVSFPAVEGFLFTAKSAPFTYQVRRDGFVFNWLKPYRDWEAFQGTALDGWKQYSEVLESPELHTVSVRFINRLEFPRADFQLTRYFTAPPQSPPGLGWSFHGFVQQNVYAVPGSGCAVHVTLAQAFDSQPDCLAYMLDIHVKLKESLTASGRKITEVLAEMRSLKNTAFFGLLTHDAISRYL